MSKHPPKTIEACLSEIGRLRKMADRQGEKEEDARRAKTKLYAKIDRHKRALYKLGWKG